MGARARHHRPRVVVHDAPSLLHARVDNIHRAADLINNTIVAPGQVFSLDRSIGPRLQPRGFVQAPVIEDNEFGTDFGGGVSQLSTTTFNAAWWGGFEIVRHTPHSLYISRYPMGREATLSAGQIDMQFRNDTQHGVWLRTSYTSTSITVRALREHQRARRARDLRHVLGRPRVRLTHRATLPPCDQHHAARPEAGGVPGEEPERRSGPPLRDAAAGPNCCGAGGETGYSVEFYRTITQPGHPLASSTSRGITR